MRRERDILRVKLHWKKGKNWKKNSSKVYRAIENRVGVKIPQDELFKIKNLGCHLEDILSYCCVVCVCAYLCLCADCQNKPISVILEKENKKKQVQLTSAPLLTSLRFIAQQPTKHMCPRRCSKNVTHGTLYVLAPKRVPHVKGLQNKISHQRTLIWCNLLF